MQRYFGAMERCRGVMVGGGGRGGGGGVMNHTLVTPTRGP